ncbi:MAG: hydrogenase maturation nickel metallochaperone HypA [candidate division KSB1 bacterium]|nr:hydrogenase maturation nickel metallochaperone HypA [candidate division KSB1 bacterium]MDZ7368317.1 hydrogenase maturation nickel metallochaperone HypA [candidate division KSB1 bacterium]MDZ7403037.1 hydrogenase maturation nickel metallochaperone HypA [candidate division KSB1 bacterium]
MHELSIASAIVDTVTQEIKRQNLPPVQTIVVRIGALSSVVPEALQFGFEAIIPDTLLANTKLQIEWTPVQGKCRVCNHEFTVEDFVFACPACQSGQIEVTRGDELEIAFLEVDEVENRG